jgi:hypothetical protein
MQNPSVFYSIFFTLVKTPQIMQHLTIEIPENRITFFTELVNTLGFKIEGKTQKSILSEKQIELVNIERKKIKDDQSHFVEWEEAQKNLNVE